MTRTICTAAFFLACFCAASASSAQTSLTITVQPGPRQTFAGLGASIFPRTPAAAYNQQVTPAQTREMARLLWRDARLRSVRLWIHTPARSRFLAM